MHSGTAGTMATSAATCDYCSELFTDPRMLPCLHTFCLPCLAKASEIQGAKEALQCPSCDEKAQLRDGGVHAFPKHLRKEHEVDVACYRSKFDSEAGVECDRCLRKNSGSAVAFCTNCCEFLCKLCREEHHSWRKTQNHEILAIGKQKSKENEASVMIDIPQQPMPCPHHKDEILKVYCMKCEKLICRDCMEFDHSDHRSQCNRVETVATRAMESLRACAEDSQGAVATLDGTIAQYRKTMQQVELRKKEVDNAITRSLEQVREALLAQNEEIRLGKITSLEMQINEMKRVREGLSHASDMILEAQSHTATQQLSTKKTLAERATHLLQQFRGSDMDPVQTDIFVTAIADQATISEMISLGQVSGGSHAASSTCDAGYVPMAVMGKERTIKVTARDQKGELYGHGGENAKASLSLLGSQDPPVQGRSTDHGDGSYSATFTAQSAGEHELHVRIANCPIRGSPFTYRVVEPRQTPYASLSSQGNISTKSSPYDVAVTEDGHLAVVERNNHTVSLYNVNGQRVYSFGTSGSRGNGDGQFYYPTAVAIRGDVMYVGEESNNRVQKFSISRQSFISKFGSSGSGNGEFSSPRGICIDPEGKVFVSDHSNHRIQVFQGDASFAYSFHCQKPWGLAFDPQGCLHVAANGSNCIQVFSPDGTSLTSYGTGTLNKPSGIAIDAEGYIAVSEYYTSKASCDYGRLWVFAPDQSLVHTARCFKYGVGAMFDTSGNLFFADSDNN